LRHSLCSRTHPITAEQAFDSVLTQTDPVTGETTSVVLVDVRTRAEYFWVGAASKVDKIFTINDDSFTPDDGKVLLTGNGRFLLFETNDRNKRLQVKKVSEILLSPIAINIPFKLWDEATGTLSINENFATDVGALASSFNVIITFCRSGGRSEDCLVDFDTSLFEAFYEIDQPDGKSGRGGFEGTSYSNVYNGYRGFPERLTEIQENPSVSWKDTGLPIKTSVNPLAE
jgi:rhodanese-related sulfurtransferase